MVINNKLKAIPYLAASAIMFIGPVVAAMSDEANAQAAARNTEQLDVIVVTARKRSEQLQDVPESITAFTSKAIESANINNIRDVALNVPNVSITSAEQPGIVLINIRGVGQVRTGEPPVAMVVDGVQLNNVNQFTQDLFDIQQIEVLKGPQGALYGRNAIGGAINIVTRQPTNEFEGMIEGTGGTGRDFRGRAAISGPIVQDKLLFRLAVAGRSFDGDIDNETRHAEVNGEKSNSERLNLLALPIDKAHF